MGGSEKQGRGKAKRKQSLRSGPALWLIHRKWDLKNECQRSFTPLRQGTFYAPKLVINYGLPLEEL